MPPKAAAAIGTRIVFFGGARYVPSGGLEVNDELHILDVAANKWLTVVASSPGKRPAARNAATLTELAGRQDRAGNRAGMMVLHGGWRAFVETYNDTYLLQLHEGL